MKLKNFDKYFYYSRAVQSPEADVDFLSKTFRRLTGRNAKIMREDFCGTFLNLCCWVKSDSNRHGVGVDLDPQPLEYGRKNYLARLSPEQQSRIRLHRANVLSARVEPADLVVALNFSYFIFKQRQDLLAYMRNARRGLKRDGLFVIDVFGGHGSFEAGTERTRKRGFWYLWEQTDVNPIDQNAKFYIHIKRDGEKLRERVFTYDWRLWTLPEVRDLMAEAGFRDVTVYWEGSNSRGGGDGNFRPQTKGEVCASWIAYVVGRR